MRLPSATLRRQQLLVLGCLLLGGLILRVAHLWALRQDILFEYPPLDADRYIQTARTLAATGHDEPGIYWQPPGFQLLLALLFRVAGPGLLVPRLLHVLASLGCVVLVFLLGRRVFSPALALAAAGILAFHGVFLHGTLELLPTVWVAFFDLLGLLLLYVATERASWPRALGAGVALGISAVFRPVILAFVPLAFLFLWKAPVRRGLLVGLFAVGILLPIAPVTVRNYRVGKEFVLISSNGGLNFYLGNNARSEETLSVRPGRHWQEITSEPRRAGVRGVNAASLYFYRKAWDFIKASPGKAMTNMARKLYLYFNGWEIPRDGDIYAEREVSRVLKATVLGEPFPFPNGVLLPLALLGVLLAWQQRHRGGLLAAYVAVQAVVTAAFFVTSRYRVPVTPVLALFAAFGAACLGSTLRQRKQKTIAVLLPTLGALLVVLNLPTRERKISYAAELAFYRGVAYRFSIGDPAKAALHFREAARMDPNDGRAYFELGNSLADLGRDEEAFEVWDRAAKADPTNPWPRRKAAMHAARRGDRPRAIRFLQESLAAPKADRSEQARDYLFLGQLLQQNGDAAAALEAFRAAKALDPRLPAPVPSAGP